MSGVYYEARADEIPIVCLASDNRHCSFGYARGSTGEQCEAAQMRQLRRRRSREGATGSGGAKSDRPQLRRLLAEVGPGDVLMVTRARPLGAVDPRPSQHPRGDHRQGSRISIPHRCVGRNDDRTRAFDAERARGLTEFERELIRFRTGEGRERAKARPAHGPTPETHRRAEGRGPSPPGGKCYACRTRAQLRRGKEHDFSAYSLSGPQLIIFGE
jgi:hypothetical protein